MTDLVTADKLCKNFGDNAAVRQVSLNIAPGEIYGLVGSDGAGKTTTLRLLVGALKADGGQVRICGCDLARQGEQARACVGYLSQRFSLYEDLTVLENIRFFAELRGLRHDQWLPRCMEILDFVDLADFKDRRAGMLSGGMKQKLGLASALVTRPQVLLLDEPTTGVDPVTRQDFWQLVIRLASSSQGAATGGAERRAVLLTTPYMDEASRCHRIGFMRAGQIIAEGTPGSLRAMLQDRILELRGEGMVNLRRIAAQVGGVEDVRAFGDRLHLRIQAGAAATVLPALQAALASRGGGALSIQPIQPTLEDVFIALSE
jgi:ABC-2 type transport system ATP-binding protein